MRLAIHPATQPWEWSASAATTSIDVCSPSGNVVLRNRATSVKTIPAIRPATRPAPILFSITRTLLLLLRRSLYSHDPLSPKLVIGADVRHQHQIPWLENVQHGRRRVLDGKNHVRLLAVGHRSHGQRLRAAIDGEHLACHTPRNRGRFAGLGRHAGRRVLGGCRSWHADADDHQACRERYDHVFHRTPPSVRVTRACERKARIGGEAITAMPHQGLLSVL